MTPRTAFLCVLLLLCGCFGTLSCMAAPRSRAGYRIDFTEARQKGSAVTGWVYRGKPGTTGCRFSVEVLDGKKVLAMKTAKGSGTLLYDLSKVDLQKYPYMRWKWRVDVYPAGGDGRIRRKDDQAIALYLGSGTSFSQHSSAYRWETDTPKGSRGFAKYAMGMVKVHWRCLRNKKDGTAKWVIDECNAKKAFERMFNGKVPPKRALSISANSQYTGTSTGAYLEYVEFYAEPLNHKKEKVQKK